MLDDAFVPVFGWRRDEITNVSGAGVADPQTGIVSENYGYGTDEMSRHFASGESKSWGGVLRLPQSWADRLPGGTNIGVFYNRSQNFKADAPRGDRAEAPDRAPDPPRGPTRPPRRPLRARGNLPRATEAQPVMVAASSKRAMLTSPWGEGWFNCRPCQGKKP